jgi:hypothetical protein
MPTAARVHAWRVYTFALSLSLEEAKTLVGQGSALHERWVGAEPLSTQFIVEKAFQNSRSIKAYGEHAKHSYQTGKQNVPRQRTAPEKVGAKQSKPHVVVGRRLKHVYK